MKVKVLDALMGSGKTTRIIEDVSKLNNRPIIYIAPLLLECHRFAGTSLDDEGKVFKDEYGFPIYQKGHPLAYKHFHHPTCNNKSGSKLESIQNLIRQGKNIVSTHALFRNITMDLVDDIKRHDYLLIIDEVMPVWEKYQLFSGRSIKDFDTDCTSTDKEINRLINNGVVHADPTGLLHWQWDVFNATDTVYQEMAHLCDTHQLCIVNGSVVFWEYPIWALKAFSDLWIATYMFESSLMCEYLRLHDIPYEVERFGNHQSSVKHLISVVDDKRMNACGEKATSLSYTNLCKSKTHNETLKVNLYNFFQNRCKAKKRDQLWTTFVAARKSISCGRYNNSWLAYNAKATNAYKDVANVAYLINLYANTMIMSLLGKRGTDFDQDQWALSEMVQFIWRSAIREGKPIKLYIPSKRMRGMFIKWLNDEPEQTTIAAVEEPN